MCKTWASIASMGKKSNANPQGWYRICVLMIQNCPSMWGKRMVEMKKEYSEKL
jgi:hypothetical protein